MSITWVERASVNEFETTERESTYSTVNGKERERRKRGRNGGGGGAQRVKEGKRRVKGGVTQQQAT